jgi:hypothetical protein
MQTALVLTSHSLLLSGTFYSDGGHHPALTQSLWITTIAGLFSLSVNQTTEDWLTRFITHSETKRFAERFFAKPV